jgi:predicted NUDIX family NTP pyrophosphohydrolase
MSTKSKHSAGLLMFRAASASLEVLLVHPGGPFWARKDLGAWSVPKGEHEPDEDPVVAARREFREETGLSPEADKLVPLGEVKQPSGKIVSVWAFEGDCDPGAIKSNTFSLEWPPRSGQMQDFPEIDRAAWFAVDEAKRRILLGQVVFLERLMGHLVASAEPGETPDGPRAEPVETPTKPRKAIQESLFD